MAMKPKMGRKIPRVDAKALTSTRKSDKVANPKSPRNLRAATITKATVKSNAKVNEAIKKNAKKKTLGGGIY